MIPEEFKTQIFSSAGQWRSGLAYRLEILKEGGLTLYSVPTFVQWLQEVDGIKQPSGMAVDECGQVYFIDAETCRFYRLDPKMQRLEQIPCISGRGSAPGEIDAPARIIMDKFTLWITDTGNHRIQAFARENYQIKYLIDDLENPVDIGVDDRAHLYILDAPESVSPQICKYGIHGNFIKTFGGAYLKKPVGLVVGSENMLYVIDEKYSGFLIFTEEGEFCGVIGDFSGISPDFKPSTIAKNRNGNIFVGDDATKRIYQFDPDGSCIGSLPDFTSLVRGLATDAKGNLYASGVQGIAFFSTQQRYTKEKGRYYSKTLDSGIPNCQWHRLALEVHIPPKSVMEVFYFASDDFELKEKNDATLADSGKTVQTKVENIESAIPWIGPARNPEDMLFQEISGQYLWLKLALTTVDEKVRPTIRQMRVYYPRISYLRYLPAIYQEDPNSKAFLERFLSLFESLFHDLENEISNIYGFFDPDTAPPDFLDWLASWLNLALEENWPEAQKRRLIRQVASFYKQKGTPGAIKTLVAIYCDREPILIEHARNIRPMVLGQEFQLGINSLLIQTPIRGFRLGDDSILGSVALRDMVQSPEEAFLPMAHRFTILLDLSAEEFARREKGLKRLLDEAIPAHTLYKLRNIDQMRVGMEAYVDINTRVTDYQPIRPGVSAVVGSGIVIMDGEPGGKVERHALLDKQTKLI